MFEFCVQMYSDDEAEQCVFHTHVELPFLDIELAGATASLVALEQNVSLKDAKIALITCAVGLDPAVCAQHEAMRQEQHPGNPAVDPQPNHKGGHRLH